jgi:hypothetical protein
VEVIINTPDFDYLKFAGAEIGSIVYTFDVDTQSTLYKFMKSRLRMAPYKITMILE